MCIALNCVIFVLLKFLIAVSERIKNSKFQIRLPLFLGLALAIGMLLGSNMFGGGNANVKGIKDGYLKIKEILTYIDSRYVDTVNTEDLVDYSIEKMLEKLDPHSSYIPKKNIREAKAQLEGSYDGIGIEFNVFKDTIYVVAPLSGGPSEKVGLQSGDKIIKVNGENVAGIKINNQGVRKRLLGKKGSKVKVKIKRSGVKELIDFTITRDKIPQNSIEVSYMIDDNTGFIKVSRFARRTYIEFRDALKGLRNKGMKRLVLDLRDNPGGYMDRAIKMADEFLPGNPKIVYTNGKGSRYDSEARARFDGMFEKGPLIVLINEGSASASEIVSGALQDNDRALIVGRRSFGKGLVQLPIDLQDGSELRLTISRYYTPSGRSIQKPYGKNPKEYRSDILKRYNSGELFSADSIKFNDSLKYKTVRKKRTVYGGGGIMPDFFIPIDTTYNSKYYRNLSAKNVFQEYSFKYYKNNQKKLEAYKLKNYIKNFRVNQAMLQDIIAMGKKAGVKYNAKELKRSEKMVKTLIKALVARRVWKEQGFYPIWYGIDRTYLKALDLFDKAATLQE